MCFVRMQFGVMNKQLYKTLEKMRKKRIKKRIENADISNDIFMKNLIKKSQPFAYERGVYKI